MKLLIIRHAIAMDQDEFAERGDSDDRRPLTDFGRKRMRKNAKGLRAVVGQIDHFATSPYTRAVETAEIVSEIFGIDQAELCASLVPSVPLHEFAEWAQPHANVGVLGIVGHEPHLSTLATWLTTGSDESAIQLKKGGACMINFNSSVRHAAGTLEWLLTPRQMRMLA